ncbi:MAG: EFR1 family ferrodoxin [Candidatus Xenobiia bacterium LiM19]
MKTVIYYYSGTGNSLWVARTLAAELGDTELISIPAVRSEAQKTEAECLGLVFPVYMWGVPSAVVKLVSNLGAPAPKYFFAVAVNAGQVAGTLVQLESLAKDRGVSLDAGFSIKMPSSYIPWGGPGPQEKLKRLYDEAREKIALIAPAVREKKKLPVEKGTLWQRILLSGLLYRVSYDKVPSMDRDFWVDEKCNGCGTCQLLCPAGNITMENGKPHWNQKCQQCFACLQWCPKEAMQYGKNTPKYERYHHPEVALKDILQSRKTGDS